VKQHDRRQAARNVAGQKNHGIRPDSFLELIGKPLTSKRRQFFAVFRLCLQCDFLGGKRAKQTHPLAPEIIASKSPASGVSDWRTILFEKRG
jgi:hypothetical protein